MAVEAGSVEYATAADGVTIAYQRFGDGPPLLRVPTIPLVLRAWPDIAHIATVLDLAPAVSTVVWDPRGVGMSDRSVTDLSGEGWVADATAVAEAIGAPVPVYATALEGPIALLLASRRPDLVSHLILGSTGGNGEALAQIPTQRAVRALMEVDWEICLNHIARTILRLEHDTADAVVDKAREEVDLEVARETYDALRHIDVGRVIPDITVPTLVIEVRSITPHQELLAGGRELSRMIPGAKLVQARDGTDRAKQMLAFLQHQPSEIHGALRTIMFTDLVSSTALTQQLGDQAAQDVVEAHDAVVRSALSAHSGLLIKHTGDGIMAAFDSPTDAARSAQQITKNLTKKGIGVRVGLNAGEPIERDGDLFGTAVQLAARVGDAASGGQVLATQVVRDLTAGKGLDWSQAPTIDARGFDEPIAVFSLTID